MFSFFYCAVIVGKSRCSTPRFYEALPKESDFVAAARDSIHVTRVTTTHARGGLRGICRGRVKKMHHLIELQAEAGEE
jgi:hypothetical protein